MVPVLVSPVLTRLYSLEAFGEFGVFTALVLGLSLIVSGRFEIAIPIPASDRTAFELLVLSLVAALVSSAVLLGIAGVVVATVPLDAVYRGLSATVLIALPLGTVFASASQSFSYWLTRKRRFGVIGRARAAQGIATGALAIAFGLGHAVPSGLIVSLVAGYFVGLVMLSRSLSTAEYRELMPGSLASLRSTARSFVEFPTVNSANALIDTARESGTMLAFSALFGPAATGLLAQTLRISRAPTSLMGQSVAQVFYQRTSDEIANGRDIVRQVRKTMLGLLAAGVPIYLTLLAAGPWLFAFVFGAPWRPSGEFARILAPWLLLNFVLSPVSLLPVVTGRQPAALRLNLVDTALRFIALGAGAYLGGPATAVAAFSVAGVCVGLFQLWWYTRLAKTAPSETRSAA
ncbi:MAG TPA: oligosaccharide flippase family protein [Coriobacteriia bacterium]